MKILCKLFFTLLFIGSFSNTNAQTTPCNLTGGSVYVGYTAPPIMMNATVNGMSQYSYSWTNGASANQNQFYSGWCVTITDLMTGCDTTICESCIPTGGVGACPMIYAPVCGCDGTIYSNDCVAMQNGIFTFTSAIGPNGQLLPCTQPSTCEVEIIGDSIICNLGSPHQLTAVPTGNGTPPYTYLWSNGQSNSPVLTIISPGTYCVTVTDANGCVDSACFTVAIEEIVIYSIPSPPNICLGDSIILSINPVNPVNNIIWVPTGNTTPTIVDFPTVSTTYIVESVDLITGCDRRGEILVTVDSCNLTTNFACMGGINPGVTTCVGPGNYALGQTYVMAVYSTMAACIADSCTVIVNGMHSEMFSKISVYPNPTKGMLNITLSENEMFTISLLTIEGKVVITESNISNSFTIYSENLAKGQYILQIENNKGTFNRKVIFE